MPMTTAFAPTPADLSEFYFDPVGARLADDTPQPAIPPQKAAAVVPQPELALAD